MIRIVAVLAFFVAGCGTAESGPPACVEGVPSCESGERPACVSWRDYDLDGVADIWGPYRYLIGDICATGGYSYDNVSCDAAGIACAYDEERPACLSDADIANAPGECM